MWQLVKGLLAEYLQWESQHAVENYSCGYSIPCYCSDRATSIRLVAQDICSGELEREQDFANVKGKRIVNDRENSLKLM